VAFLGKMRSAYTIMINLKRRDHLRPRRRREDIFKMYFKEIGLEVVDWIHLAQDRVQW
jgi:hypothetical protein